jgi:hypothetical protein
VYTPHAIDEIAAAIGFLREEPGVSEVHALGLCSGAYHAFKAAVAGVPLDGIVLVNPLVFFYRPGMPLDPPAAPFVTSEGGLQSGDDLAGELERIASKNISLRFLFANGDPGFKLLHEQGGSTVESLRRRGRISIDVIDGADHTFTPLWSHPILISRLGAQFDALPA